LLQYYSDVALRKTINTITNKINVDPSATLKLKGHTKVKFEDAK